MLKYIICILAMLLCTACGNENTENEIVSSYESEETYVDETTNSTTNNIETSTLDESISENITSDSSVESSMSTENTETETTIKETEKNTTERPTEAVKVEYNYSIRINVKTNCVTIYKKDESGAFTIPYKAMTCSTGRENRTPLGTNNISEYYKWCRMVDWTYGQYAYRIKGGIMFHSTPCALNLTINSQTPVPTYSKGRIEVEEYNKLGTNASLGCIRLTVADAKWICDNCPKGTIATIVSEDTDPLPKPEVIKIPENIPSECGGYVETLMPENYKSTPIVWVKKRIYVAWDPTDPDPKNPWNKYTTTIDCADELIVDSGCELNDILKQIIVKDTCGNIINEKLKISGDYDISKPGEYMIELSATDALNRTAVKTVKLIINESTVEETTTVVETTTSSEETTEKTGVETETTTIEEVSKETETTTIEEDSKETETTTTEEVSEETETTTTEESSEETETTTTEESNEENFLKVL